MSYNIKYTVPFKSINDVPCIIEILEDGFTGVATELTGGTTPFKVKLDDDDFLYTPLRFSSATIKLVGGDYMQSLFSTNYQQFKVVFKRNNVVKWIGFIKPEVYTQDYSVEPFELEIQCQSALSVLEFIDYKTAGEKIDFISLFDLIARSILESKGGYQNVYIPHVYARDAVTYNSLDNVLSEMKVSEQNFFDEEGEPMKLKDVLEEVCKLLNWTCHVWNDSVYFIDINHSGQYYKFNNDLSSFEMVNPLNTVNVQGIGFSGSSHSLDILGGYNKATIRISNYNVGEIFPNEDFPKLKLYSNPSPIIDGNNKCEKKYYYSNVYKLNKFRDADYMPNVTDEELEQAQYKENPANLLGAFPIKWCSYTTHEENGTQVPDITNYTWEEAIQVRLRGLEHVNEPGGYRYLNGQTVLSYKAQLPVAAFGNYALAISMEIKRLGRDDLGIFGNDSSDTPGDNIFMRCVLKIGDYTKSFNLPFNASEYKSGSWTKNVSTKKLDQPYSGLDGYIIEVPEYMVGEMSFYISALNYNTYERGYLIRNLKLTSQKRDEDEAETDKDSDRIYENVVNENFINPLDEIEHKISTYNHDDLSYSKVMFMKPLESSENRYLKDNLYSIIAGKQIRLEEHLIRRIINQYQATKIKLTQILKYTEAITPATTITDTYMGSRKFIMTGGEIDYEQEEFNCIMIEFNGNYQE